MIAIPGDSDHAVRRRGSGGFLYVQRRISTSAANLTTVLPAPYHPTAVFVEVGTGNGKQEHIMKVSTTSTLTWLQCKPCSPMAPQMQALFDPAASPTYHAFTSASPRCPQPPYHKEPRTGLCVFHLAEVESARGYLSTDHFRIIDHGGVDPFYAFGCAHSTWRFDSGGASGVLAMGRAPASLVSQAAARGLTSFSYCLSRETKTRHQGFLRFGDGAHDSAYYVSLVGVSVGERRLAGVRPEMFGHGGGGGCIVDIGTPVTALVESAYGVVEDAVWSGLERHGAGRVEQGGYGLCVRATEAVKERLPSLSLHFAGEDATLVISPEQLFVMVDDERAGPGQVACLALVPGRRTVIGALQQVGTRFVFDLKDNKLSFAPESCVHDTAPVA
ncbi:unnamed protein product [Urochloa decumbens]|uniref:Peptidase A1 domain-containing protein n=1 Tax=Urochloa decumbens TaxID=240449 RepID=A0ABC9GUF6_9POAL